MMYYMNWVLTNAQIELIAADVSVIDYGSGMNDKKKHSKGEFDDTKADPNEVRKAAKEWRDRYGEGKDAGKGLSVSDLFGGGMKTSVGVKLD